MHDTGKTRQSQEVPSRSTLTTYALTVVGGLDERATFPSDTRAAPVKAYFKRYSRVSMAVDAVGAIGVIATVTYVLYGRRLFAPGSEALDVWPDAAMNLVGIWLGVRFIDALIQAREQRLRKRDWTVSNLRYQLQIARRLSPKFYAFDLQSLREEVTWLTGELPDRFGVLSKDEQQDVSAVMETVRTLVEESNQYAALKESISDAFTRIEHAIDAHHRTSGERLFRGDLPGLASVEREYWRFDDKAVYSGNLHGFVADAQREIARAHLPDNVASAVDEYLSKVGTLIELRSKVTATVERVGSGFRTAESNILEENRSS